jgi:hypothetical protein
VFRGVDAETGHALQDVLAGRSSYRGGKTPTRESRSFKKAAIIFRTASCSCARSDRPTSYGKIVSGLARRLAVGAYFAKADTAQYISKC